MIKSKNPSLVLYAMASVVTIITTVLECDWLTFFVKPIIVPAIFYYYLQRNKYKIQLLFFLAIISSYASDMIVLMTLENSQVMIVLLNMLTYVIMLYYVVHDISVKEMGLQKIIYFAGNLLSFLAIVYIMLTLISNMTTVSLAMNILYGLISSILASLAIINHVSTPNLKTFYSLIMCICFVTTDVFYIVYNFYMKMDVFLLLNLAAQFVSYFYMISYMTTAFVKENENDIQRD